MSKLDKEMQKFVGKIMVGEGAETNSEMTNATKMTKSSQPQRQSAVRPGSPGLDEIDEAATMNTGHVGGKDEPGPGDDDEMDEEAALAAKKKQDGNQLDEYFKDANGEQYNPDKKFGIIEGNSLIYDNVTTSYPLNLPTDYYQKYINQNMPTKESGNGKWFIRPHHLETLT